MDVWIKATLPLLGVGALTFLLSIFFCSCLWCLRRQGEREIGYREVKYNRLRKSAGEVCAVCLDEFSHGEKIALCQCHHSFHRKCLVQWLAHNNSCPLCKQKVHQDTENTNLV